MLALLGMAKTILIAALFLFGQISTAQIEFKGRPEALVCKAFLVPVLEQMIVGSRYDAALGNLNDLLKLLTASGAGPETIRATGFLFQSLLGLAPPGHIFESILRRLLAVSGEEKKLLFCVVSGDCKLKHGGAVHVSTQTQFEIRAPEVSTSDGNSRYLRGYQKPGWLRERFVTKPEGELFGSAILIQGGPSQTPVELLIRLVHETAHAADFALVAEWISANLKLVAHKREPDPLFQAFVRNEESARPVVNEGFFRVFLESRGYAVESLTLTTLMGGETQHDSRLRHAVFEDFGAFSSVTDPIVRTLRISTDNVFEVGMTFGQTMEATIDRALSLP